MAESLTDDAEFEALNAFITERCGTGKFDRVPVEIARTPGDPIGRTSMPLFGRKQQPPAEPLITAPVGGEEIVLDEEERVYIERSSRFVTDGLKDQVFEEQVAQGIQDGLTASALVELARERMTRGDLKGAASSAVKAIGLASYMPSAWLMLAESFARYGDPQRAQFFIKKAEEAARAAGLRDEYWRAELQQVKAPER